MFFSQIVRFFENSKNRKLQTLVASTFGDHTVKWISILALKWTNFTFFRVSQKGCTKNTKNSVLKRAIRNYSTKLLKPFDLGNIRKKHTIWLKSTKMGRMFSSVLDLMDFLSNSKIAIHLLNIGSVNWAGKSTTLS